MRPLVILRPEPGASATAKAAREMGLRPLVMPLFRVEPLAWQAPDPARFDALLLTSANALRHAGVELEQLRGLRVYCVGDATASAAREAGLVVAGVGEGGVDPLLDSLPPDLKLLHLSGAQRNEPGGARQSIDHLPVYEAVEMPRPERFGEVEGAVIAVHSPRAASVLVRHAGEVRLDRGRIAIAAISVQAAEAAGHGWETVEASDEPSDTALLAIAARLCDNCG